MSESFKGQRTPEKNKDEPLPEINPEFLAGAEERYKVGGKKESVGGATEAEVEAMHAGINASVEATHEGLGTRTEKSSERPKNQEQKDNTDTSKERRDNLDGDKHTLQQPVIDIAQRTKIRTFYNKLEARTNSPYTETTTTFLAFGSGGTVAMLVGAGIGGVLTAPVALGVIGAGGIMTGIGLYRKLRTHLAEKKIKELTGKDRRKVKQNDVDNINFSAIK